MRLSKWVGDERQMAEPLLQLKSVSKSFKEVNVLKDIDLEIYNGQIIGLVGGNGAGKTTLLRLMTGVYRPTSGNVTYQNGKAIHEARENVGIVPESTGLYSKLTAWENIRYHSRIFGLDDETAWRRTSKFANELNMSSSLNRHTKGFSRGMKQKTALLRAIVHHPSILILDEPTAGLDITSARNVRNMVSELGSRGGTVIYSTHHLSEAEKICNRIIMIHNGNIVADGTPEELIAQYGFLDLEELYVNLTQEDAVIHQTNDEQESRLARIWRKFMTRSKYTAEEEE